MHQDDWPPRDRPHIFAVDGSSDFLDVLRDLFQEERYRVTTTHCAPQTFDQIAALTLSLLIIDVAVGKHTAQALLEPLSNDASVQRIPTIVVSTSPSLLDQARDYPDRGGGQRFLRKPLDLDDLLGAVEALMGPAQRQSAAIVGSRARGVLPLRSMQGSDDRLEVGEHAAHGGKTREEHLLVGVSTLADLALQQLRLTLTRSGERTDRGRHVELECHRMEWGVLGEGPCLLRC